MTLDLKAKAIKVWETMPDLKVHNAEDGIAVVKQALQEVREETIRECAGIVGDFAYEDGEVLGIFVKEKILALLPPPKTGKP